MSKATKALTDYGFVAQPDGSFVLAKNRRGKVRFVPQDGGFHNFRREDGQWRQYPFSIHEEWQGVGGLAFDAIQGTSDPNAKVKPECFEWVFPDSWVISEYEAGAAAKAERAARKAG